MSPSTRKDPILVWDLPLRAFHWLLAASFTGALLTAESERYRDIHAVLGYTAIALVAFRVVWGFVGTRYARFRSFPLSPRQAIAYLRALAAWRPQHHVGHNPAGAMAIYALLALVFATALAGAGALNGIGAMFDLHESLAYATLALVAVHVAAVAIGSVAHRDNLVRSMLTGFKRGRRADGIDGARPAAAAGLVAVVLALWTGVVPLPGLETGLPLIEVTGPSHAAVHAVGRDDD